MVVADKISGGGAVQEMLGSVAAAGEGEGLTKEEVRVGGVGPRTVHAGDVGGRGDWPVWVECSWGQRAAWGKGCARETGAGAGGGAGARCAAMLSMFGSSGRGWRGRGAHKGGGGFERRCVAMGRCRSHEGVKAV